VRALVTGGGGFLGGAIVRLLLADGHNVRSFSRREHPELDILGVETCQGNLAEEEAIEKACRGCDIVFHVAAKAGIWGEKKGLLSDQCHGNGERHSSLPLFGDRPACLHQLSQRCLRRKRYGGGR